MITARTLITAATGAAALLFAAEAQAATFNFCIRLPVTIGDEVGSDADVEAELGLAGGTANVHEVGMTGNWIARGIRIESLERNGVAVAGFSPTFADASTGCFTQSYTTLSGSATWRIGVKSYGRLAGDNELRTHNSGGLTSYYEADITVSNAGGTFYVVWPTEYKLLRMYAILAYAIQEGFRGNWTNETLRAWYASPGAAGASPCGCDDATNFGACTCSSGGQGHISIPDNQSTLRFVLGHEYGHRVIGDVLSFSAVNNCNLDSNNDGVADTGHGMTTLEWNSCAAMEGWAHFVSADIWTTSHHAGGDPQGWFRYFGDLVDAEAEWQAGATCNDYIRQYGDQCFPLNSRCNNGNPFNPAVWDCDQVGVELDWMRTFWDYHTDDDLPGAIRSHLQLQQDLNASGGWSSSSAWDDIDDGMTARGQGARWQSAGDYNGASEP